MCLGIPGRIVEITDADLNLAVADVSGVKRKVNVTCVSGEGAAALVGQWVLIHVGFAMAIIDEINDDGLLGTTLEEICETLARSHEGSDAPPALEEIEEILQRVQQFDPIGVGARDLQECLLLQLEQLDETTPWLTEARNLVTTHLHVLGNKDFVTLVRQTHLSESQLSQVVALIRTLQPRPGAALFEETADYEVPDVLVRKDQGRWLVELNPETLPKVRINNTYASLIKSVPTGPDKDGDRPRWRMPSTSRLAFA